MAANEIEIRMMAKEAMEHYLSNGKSLTESITEMAKTASLNPYEIARLCEQANVDTYATLFTKVGSGDFQFPLAEQNDVIDGVRKSASPVPLCEYEVPPSELSELVKESNHQLEKSFEKFAKYSSGFDLDEDPTPTKAHKLITKLAGFAERLEGAQLEATMEIEDLTSKVAESLRQAHLNGEDIGGVFPAALAVCDGNDSRVGYMRFALKKVAEKLLERNIDFLKEAERFTEDTMGNLSKKKRKEYFGNVDFVVDKSNPIIRHLDTIVDTCSMLGFSEEPKQFVLRKIDTLKSYIDRKYGS